jgi:hypothetical protein
VTGQNLPGEETICLLDAGGRRAVVFGPSADGSEGGAKVFEVDLSDQIGKTLDNAVILGP